MRFTPGGFVSVVKLLLEQLNQHDQQPQAGPGQPLPERSFEHKLEVLRGLRKAGAFAALEQALAPGPEPGDKHEGADDSGSGPQRDGQRLDLDEDREELAR